jgi:hypothetical protein
MIEPEDKGDLVDDVDRKQRDLDGIAGIERKLLEENLAGIVTEDQFDNLMTEYSAIVRFTGVGLGLVRKC